MDITNNCIIISGPTAVGKTDFVDSLAANLPAEIINADMGQMYEPLCIGTAKPDWQNQAVPHHMFDIIAQPQPFTVNLFRERLTSLFSQIWQKDKLPIVVGGSGYYLFSLFFPPVEHEKKIIKQSYPKNANLWDMLNKVDPERAQEIGPSDPYRLQRALDIYTSMGKKPSLYKPEYKPIARYFFLWLERDRDELYQRIDGRVVQMLNEGWIKEVEGLLDTEWEAFLLQKKIIGYPEVVAYCRGQVDKAALIKSVQKKTRNYAKRQMTFFRMLKKKLETANNESASAGKVVSVNLTHTAAQSYIKQLIVEIKHWIQGKSN